MVQLSFFFALALFASSAFSLTIPTIQDLAERASSGVGGTLVSLKDKPRGPRVAPPKKKVYYIPPVSRTKPVFGTRLEKKPNGPRAHKVIESFRGQVEKDTFDEQPMSGKKWKGKGKAKEGARRRLPEVPY